MMDDNNWFADEQNGSSQYRGKTDQLTTITNITDVRKSTANLLLSYHLVLKG